MLATKLRVQAYLVWERGRRQYAMGVLAYTSMDAKNVYAECAGLPLYEVDCTLAPSGTKCFNPLGVR